MLTAYLLILAFFFGASLASFTAVVVERLPQGKSVLGRSYCVCGRQLKASENIPVIGWAKTWGTAKCCGAKIPAWYVIFEILGGAMAVAVTATAIALYL